MLSEDAPGDWPQTVQNDQDGTVNLPELVYTDADVGKTYRYKVREVNDKQTGYSYDTATYIANVRVFKEGEELAAYIWWEKDGGEVKASEVVFKNTTTPPEEAETEGCI